MFVYEFYCVQVVGFEYVQLFGIGVLLGLVVYCIGEWLVDQVLYLGGVVVVDWWCFQCFVGGIGGCGGGFGSLLCMYVYCFLFVYWWCLVCVQYEDGGEQGS